MLVNACTRPVGHIAVRAIQDGHRVEHVVGSVGTDLAFVDSRLGSVILLAGGSARRIGRHAALVGHQVAAPYEFAEIHAEDKIRGLNVQRNHIVEDRLALDDHLHIQLHDADIGRGSRNRQFDLAVAFAFDRSRIILDRQAAAE